MKDLRAGRSAWLAVLSCILLGETVTAAEPVVEPARTRTLEELRAIAESSKKSYTLEWVSPESAAGQAILQSLEQVADYSPRPSVEVDDGAVRLTEWSCKDGAEVLLAEGEKSFVGGDYQAAQEGYIEATRIDPRCYVAHSHVGDTFLRTGNETMALAHYNRAIELNPNDHKTFVYRGHAHLRQGDGELALDDFRTALTLRPHFWLVEGILRNYEGYPVVLRDARLQAPLRVVRTGKSSFVTQVLEGARDTPWEAYGLCRALWRGEGLAARGAEAGLTRKQRRRAATQRQVERDIEDGEARFDMAEEQECLSAALESHLATADDATAGNRPLEELDPFEALQRARVGGLFDQALLYGVAAQRFSQTMILLGDQQQQRMREFVERFVLLPRAN